MQLTEKDLDWGVQADVDKALDDLDISVKALDQAIKALIEPASNDQPNNSIPVTSDNSNSKLSVDIKHTDVKTGDYTNAIGLLMLGLLAAGSLLGVRRKSEEI